MSPEGWMWFGWWANSYRGGYRGGFVDPKVGDSERFYVNAIV